MENVVLIGASANEERYSNKAMKLLAEHGHNPIPVSPAAGEILGHRTYSDISAIDTKIDTVTMYISPQRQDDKLFEQIIELKPKRVIFNPETENPERYESLRAAGIEPVEACTLVMLRTGQF